MTAAASTTVPELPVRERILTAVPAEFRTVVADWETCPDSHGEDHSPAMPPVVITVPATNKHEALEAAADKLQAHFGPVVEPLYRTDIQRDEWFGDNDFTPLLRVCTVQIGIAILDDEDDFPIQI